MAYKKRVEVEVCIPGVNTFVIKGRLLGLMNDKELAYLIKDEEVQRKTLTTQSVNPFELFDDCDELEGQRVVFAVREEDDKPVNKTLLISGPMEMVASYSPNDKWIYLAGPKCDLSITEIEEEE